MRIWLVCAAADPRPETTRVRCRSCRGTRRSLGARVAREEVTIIAIDTAQG
jgi:hypothetical protein